MSQASPHNPAARLEYAPTFFTCSSSERPSDSLSAVKLGRLLGVSRQQSNISWYVEFGENLGGSMRYPSRRRLSGAETARQTYGNVWTQTVYNQFTRYTRDS